MQGAAAFVVKGSLVIFTDVISNMEQNDVLNSVLLAQLAADKQKDRFATPEAWLKLYADTLEHLGWSVVQATGFSQVSLPEEFTAESFIAPTGIANPATVKTFEILRTLPNDNQWRAMLSGSSRQPPSASTLGAINFQVCEVGALHGVLRTLCGNAIVQYKERPRLFCENLPPYEVQGSLLTSVVVLESNATLEALRDQIIQKLGDNRQKLIGNLDIS